MLNFIIAGIDKPGHYAQLCMIDFTKAFDRVNHTIVIQKLLDLGVRSSVVPIVCSFLTTRTQNTKLNGHISATRTITCGVPQGAKLGPILFLMLVNDAAIDCCRRWKYVDDLSLGEIIKYGDQSQMQSHLHELSGCCQQNDVLPKPSKCQSMIISFLKCNVPRSVPLISVTIIIML